MRTQPCSVESVIPKRENVPFEAPKRKIITSEDVIYDVAESTGISVEKIKGRSRKRVVVVSRFISCYVSYLMTGESLEDIGNALGARDHTTILHARDKAQNYLITEDEIYMKGWNLFLENSKLFNRYDFKKFQ